MSYSYCEAVKLTTFKIDRVSKHLLPLILLSLRDRNRHQSPQTAWDREVLVLQDRAANIRPDQQKTGMTHLRSLSLYPAAQQPMVCCFLNIGFRTWSSIKKWMARSFGIILMEFDIRLASVDHLLEQIPSALDWCQVLQIIGWIFLCFKGSCLGVGYSEIYFCNMAFLTHSGRKRDNSVDFLGTRIRKPDGKQFGFCREALWKNRHTYWKYTYDLS